MKIYRPEYLHIIDIYCDLIALYNEQSCKLTDSDFYERTPLLLSVENLRKDILQYSNQLGLTPSGYKKIKGDQRTAKQSGLAVALSKAYG